MEHIQVIEGDDEEQLSESLDSFVGEIINAKVTITLMHGEIAVPKLIETYKDDFGGTDEAVIEFIYKYLDSFEIEMGQALQQISEKSL